MITPSALNVVIIGLSCVVFFFILRTIATWKSDTPIGQALAVIV